MDTPFHKGELEVQTRAGERAAAEGNAPMIGGKIMGGALPFLRQQTMAVVGTRDAAGRLWCSLLFGSPGFLASPNGTTITLDRTQLSVQVDDPLWANAESGAQAGMLVIDLATRRRIRINGVIAHSDSHKLVLQVEQSFPNCPKYITRRELNWEVRGEVDSAAASAIGGATVSQGQILGPQQIESLRQADTLFLATAHPDSGIDASHRGGLPGFVEVLDASTIRIPDYLGNSLFNTLGNLQGEPRTGIAVPDFARGRCLQLTGRTRLLWSIDAKNDAGNDAAHDARNDAGSTGRLLHFELDRWIELPLPRGLKTTFQDYSPWNEEIPHTAYSKIRVNVR